MIIDELTYERTRPRGIVDAVVKIHTGRRWVNVMRSSGYGEKVDALRSGSLERVSGREGVDIDQLEA